MLLKHKPGGILFTSSRGWQLTQEFLFQFYVVAMHPPHANLSVFKKVGGSFVANGLVSVVCTVLPVASA